MPSGLQLHLGLGDEVLVPVGMRGRATLNGATVYGPLPGAIMVKTLGEATKLATGDAPGLDLVIYGCVLILVVAFAPRGIAGLLRRRA